MEKDKIKYFGIIKSPAALLVLIALIISACDSDSPFTSLPGEDIQLSTGKTYIGDTITVFGTGFGKRIDESGICMEGDLFVSSYDCIRWGEQKIVFEIPIAACSGTVSVCVANDTLKPVNIEVEKLPPFQMVKINPGTFFMGSNTGFDEEMPLREVAISKPFYISKYEVNILLYKAVTGIGDSYRKDLPLSNVSWEDAILFCNEISKITGFDTCYSFDGEQYSWNKDANGYRLPTEAEWEYAARAGSRNDFYSYIDNAAWYNENSGYKVHPGGLKSANEFGLFDMMGNVREWCWDYFAEDYTNAYDTDPSGPLTGERRVQRGGCYADGRTWCRLSNRVFPDYSEKFCGIRLVRNAN